MKYIIDIPNEMVIKSPLKGLTLGIAMLETSTQKQFILPTNIPLMPYIEPQKWVSCDERLPEDYTRVLTTNSKIGAWEVDINSRNVAGWIYSSDPVAWMPLPEPWKGEEE